MIAFISCSNGLGHIKRIILISNYLNKTYGLKSSIYAPKIKFNHLIGILLKQNDIQYIPELIDFDTNTKIENWKNGTQGNWKNKIQDLNRFKLVISDNLIEILDLRSDAIISASFFWSHIFSNKDLKQKTQKLIEKYNPIVIGNKYMSLDPFYKNFNGIGFCISKKQPYYFEKKNLLVSAGKDGSDDKLVIDLITYFSTNKPSNINNIFLEPRMFNESLPKYFRKADFTAEMYKSVLISVIRPGLGTITDCLNHGIYILSSANFKNIELSQNALNLKELGLGDIFNNMFQLEKLIVNFKEERTSFRRNLSQIDFSGTEQMGDLINKFYSEK